jgi:hypothetical protein
MTLVLKSNYKHSSTGIKCYFCNGTHTCRECPIEANMAPLLKKKVGIMMEYYIADNFKCPECTHMSLKVIGNHTPSLDIICQNCDNKFEVKSKCLSISRIPNDIKLPHGSYIDYMYRIKEGLNLIVLIYGVDRIKKEINIREVLYANNWNLSNPDVIETTKRHDSNLSTIFIKNKKYLTKLHLDTNKLNITFKDDFDNFKNGVTSSTSDY